MDSIGIRQIFQFLSDSCFIFFSDSTNTLYLSPEGGTDAVVNIHPLDFTTPFNSCIIAHGSDLIDKDTSGITSKSPISYSLSGVSPSRIFKLEFRNAGFTFGIQADSINLQLWIYETTDVIEVRFGLSNYVSSNADLYDNGPGPWVGLVDSLDRNASTIVARQFYQFTGPVLSPSLDSATTVNTSLPFGMTGNPTSGSVYRFSPKLKPNGNVGYSSYNTVISNDINYFADKQELRIDIFADDRFNYQIIDLNGNVLTEGCLYKGRKIINTSTFQSGLYILKLASKHENIAYKLVR